MSTLFTRRKREKRAERGEIQLGKALEALRGELDIAVAHAQGQHVRFQISDLTLTLQTVAHSDEGAALGMRWYVLTASAGRSRQDEITQTLVLNITPLLARQPYDGPGGDPAGRMPPPVPPEQAGVVTDWLIQPTFAQAPAVEANPLRVTFHLPDDPELYPLVANQPGDFQLQSRAHAELIEAIGDLVREQAGTSPLTASPDTAAGTTVVDGI